MLLRHIFSEKSPSTITWASLCASHDTRTCTMSLGNPVASSFSVILFNLT